MELKNILLWILGSGIFLFVISIVFGFDEEKNLLTSFVKLMDECAKNLDWFVNSISKII